MALAAKDGSSLETILGADGRGMLGRGARKSGLAPPPRVEDRWELCVQCCVQQRRTAWSMN